MKSFAQRLTAYRDAHGWTNEALAEYLAKVIGRAVARRTVECWLIGQREPHPLWRKEIEKALC